MRHIIKDIKAHLSHYLVLVFILLFGGFSFLYFQANPQAQIMSAFLTASFYVLWGIVHHLLEGNLHLRIVIEYVAVSLLGFLILYSLSVRA